MANPFGNLRGVVTVEPTLPDRIVGWFSPKALGRRLLQREALVAMTGGYAGGRRNRRGLRDWNPLGGSADDDLLFDLPALRERSRDLERNSGLARGAINTITTSVVGTGLVPIPQVRRDVLGLTIEQAEGHERQISDAVTEWLYSLDADATRAQAFVEQQELALRSALVSGDCFAVERYIARSGVPWLLCCQLVEADRVANPVGVPEGGEAPGRPGYRIKAGIEQDAMGAAVAIHVHHRIPGRLTRENAPAGEADVVRIPIYGADGRRRVHHVFRRPRIDASRGEPILAPVIELVKQLGDYTENEVRAAVVSSLFTVFVTSSDGQGLAAVPTSASAAEASAARDAGEVKMGSGAIVDLDPGDKVEFANPTRPNVAFDPFVMAILRQIGVALELPFELLIKHFQSSYSAARAALLEAWRMIRMRRAWLSERLCQPFYEALVHELVLRGTLVLPGFLDDPRRRAAWLWCEWQGPAPGHIDEAKAVQAAEARLKIRVTTYARETAELTGGDWRRVEEQRQAEDARIARGAVPAQLGHNGGPALDDAGLVEDPDADPVDDTDATDEPEE